MRLSNCLLKKKNFKSEIQRVYKFMKGQTEVTYNWKQPFCVSIMFLENNLIYNNGRSIQNIFSEIKTTTPTTNRRDKQRSKMSL